VCFFSLDLSRLALPPHVFVNSSTGSKQERSNDSEVDEVFIAIFPFFFFVFPVFCAFVPLLVEGGKFTNQVFAKIRPTRGISVLFFSRFGDMPRCLFWYLERG